MKYKFRTEDFLLLSALIILMFMVLIILFPPEEFQDETILDCELIETVDNEFYYKCTKKDTVYTTPVRLNVQ